MNKEQIVSLVKNHEKDEEFNTLQYPNHKEALVEFFQENGIELSERDIAEEEGKPYIDSDGYTGVDSKLSIPSLSLTISITAFQHKGWDFYFNDIE